MRLTRETKAYKSSAEFWIGVPVRHHLHSASTNLLVQQTQLPGCEFSVKTRRQFLSRGSQSLPNRLRSNFALDDSLVSNSDRDQVLRTIGRLMQISLINQGNLSLQSPCNKIPDIKKAIKCIQIYSNIMQQCSINMHQQQ